MSAKILEGKSLAREILDRLGPRIAVFRRRRGRAPSLAIVCLGQDPLSEIYARKKLEACRRIGIVARLCAPPAPKSELAVLRWLEKLGKDRRVDAITIESPVPRPFDFTDLSGRLPELKDAEGLSHANFGKLMSTKTWDAITAARFPVPATALAILALIRKSRVRLWGARAVVVGRSTIVGLPTARLLSSCDATVTLCHSNTRDLAKHLKTADIVVSAVGRRGLIRGRDLKRSAVIIDAGITRQEGRLLGDVDFKSAAAVAGWITPVPGGVGPLTTAYLLSNVLLCAERNSSL